MAANERADAVRHFIDQVRDALASRTKSDIADPFVSFAVSHPIRRRFETVFLKQEEESLVKKVNEAAEGSGSREGFGAHLLACADVLKELGIGLDAKDNHGRTLTHYAARLGDVQCFLFLESFATSGQYSVLDNFHRSTAHLAALGGHTKMLAVLLAKEPPPPLSADRYGQTPSDIAARHCHWECLKLLTEPKAANSLWEKEPTHGASWHLPLLGTDDKSKLDRALKEVLRGAAGRGGSATVNAVSIDETRYAVRVDLAPRRLRDDDALPNHVRLIDGACHVNKENMTKCVLVEQTRSLIMPLAGRWAWRSPQGLLAESQKSKSYCEVWVEVAYFVWNPDKAWLLSTMIDPLAQSLTPDNAKHAHEAMISTRNQLTEMNLAHGDLKPQNIFIVQQDVADQPYRAMFIDFTSLCERSSIPFMTTRGYYPVNGSSGEENDEYALRVIEAELLLRVPANEPQPCADLDMATRRNFILSEAIKIFCSFDFDASLPPGMDFTFLQRNMPAVLPSCDAKAERTLRRIRCWADADPAYIKTEQDSRDLEWLNKFSPPLFQIANLLFDESGKRSEVSGDLLLAAVDTAVFAEHATTRLGIAAIQRMQLDESQLLEIFAEHGRQRIADAVNTEEVADPSKIELDSTSMPSLSFSAEFTLSSSDIDTIVSFFLAATPQPSAFSYELAAQCVQLVARRNAAPECSWITLLPQYLQDLTGTTQRFEPYQSGDEKASEKHVMAQYTPTQIAGVRFARVVRFDRAPEAPEKFTHVWLEDTVALPGDLQYVDEKKKGSAEANHTSWSVDYPMFMRHVSSPPLRRVRSTDCSLSLWTVTADVQTQGQQPRAAPLTLPAANAPPSLSRHAALTAGEDNEAFLDSLQRACHMESFTAEIIDFDFLRKCVAVLVDKPFMTSLRVRVTKASALDLFHLTFLCRELGWAHLVIDCETLERVKTDDPAWLKDLENCNGTVANISLNVKNEWQYLLYYEALKYATRPDYLDFLPSGIPADVRTKIDTMVNATGQPLRKIVIRCQISDNDAMTAVYHLSTKFQAAVNTALPAGANATTWMRQTWENKRHVLLDAYYKHALIAVPPAAALPTATTIRYYFVQTKPAEYRIQVAKPELTSFVSLITPAADPVIRPPNSPPLTIVTVLNLSTFKRGTGAILKVGETTRFYTALHNVRERNGKMVVVGDFVISFDNKPDLCPKRFLVRQITNQPGASPNETLDTFSMLLTAEEKQELVDGPRAFQCGIWVGATKLVKAMQTELLRLKPPPNVFNQFAIGYPEGLNEPHIFFSRQVKEDQGDLTNAGVICPGLSGAIVFPFEAAHQTHFESSRDKSIVTRSAEKVEVFSGFLRYPAFKSARFA